jgi:putative phosphoesterase
MKLGILSDSHNNLTNLQAVLKIFRQAGVTRLVHCGDITTPETAAAMGDFLIIHTLGNGDYASGAIRQELLNLNPSNFSGLTYKGDVEGIAIAVTHGHHPGMVHQLAESGLYRYIFYGHSHRRRDEISGTTRLLNPGALGGLKAEDHSACILDLITGSSQFIFV